MGIVRPYIDAQKINYRILGRDRRVVEYLWRRGFAAHHFHADRDGRIAAMHVGLVSKGSMNKTSAIF